MSSYEYCPSCKSNKDFYIASNGRKQSEFYLKCGYCGETVGCVKDIFLNARKAAHTKQVREGVAE